MKITRENCETVKNFEPVSKRRNKGDLVRVRRNGKTKLWKRQPDKFRIPVKYGLRHYFYITNQTAWMWNAID